MSERDRYGEKNPSYRHGCAPRAGMHREYRIWAAMKTRCTNPNQKSWSRYGGRGIAVCDRWFNSFETFLADMGRCPSPKHSLDRIDNSKGYSPDNCRWATYLQQSHNSAAVKLVTVAGQLVPMNVAARLLGVDRTMLTKRIASGMTPQQAVDCPTNMARSAGVRAAWARKKGLAA